MKSCWLKRTTVCVAWTLFGATGCIEKVNEQADVAAVASADAATKAEIADNPDAGLRAETAVAEDAVGSGDGGDADPSSDAAAADVSQDVQAEVGDAALDAETVDTAQDATVAADAFDADIKTSPDAAPEVTPDAAVDAVKETAVGVDAAAEVDAAPLTCTQDCASLSAGNPCIVGVCDNGSCVAKPVTKATTCDDSNDCTKGDSCCLAGEKFCTSGSCKSGGNICECQANDPAECEGLKGDGNKCNGLQYCDTSALPFVCKQLPNSEVNCPKAKSECEKVACVPATSQCETEAIKEGENCASLDACTANVCEVGACVVDTNKCECASNADCTKKNDANLCTGTHYCDKSQPGKNTCKINAAAVVSCANDADSTCSKNVCVPATGKCAFTAAELTDCSTGTCKVLPPGQPAKTNLGCEDGNKCTIGDQCGGGQCKSGTQTCGCTSQTDCLAQEDGDPCNGTLYCDKVVGKCKLNPATVITCGSAGEFCRKNACKPVPGNPSQGVCVIENANEGVPCNDGILCTAGDHCETGQCSPTANICTCAKTVDCYKAEDGDLCNGTLICDLSQKSPTCVVNPATIVSCGESGNACQVTACEKISGKCKTTPNPDGTLCDFDGTPCTAFDSCAAGACKAGVKVCACQNSSDCQKFEDGNLCNGTLYCDAKEGACKVNPATVVSCPASANACQVAYCEPAAGICGTKAVGEGTPCEADGSLCTPGDTCSAGKCVVGANLCGCLKDSDCIVKEDGNLCNGTLYCQKGSGPPHCAINPATPVTCTADDNPCTTAECDPKTGKCGNPPVAQGSACEDGKPCTYGDTCMGGSCTAGLNNCNCTSATDCIDDGNPCNGLPFCAQGQCSSTAPIACSGGVQGCNSQQCDSKTGVCAYLPKACNDNNPCTADACDSKVGACSFKAFGDGSPCATGQVCVGGACSAISDGQVVVGGGLWMGCNVAQDPQCLIDEYPQHFVQILPVAIDRLEVSVAAYASCVKAGKCTAAGQGKLGDGMCNSGQPFADSQPINCVNVAQAEAFCAQKGQRLPSEAEWELAARGPCITALCKTKTPRFPWGNLPLPLADCAQTWMAGSVASGCNLGITLECGAKLADKSGWGVYDLAGNVMEWTTDGYDAEFYGKAEAIQPSPKAPVGKGKRVVRGGGGASVGSEVRTSARKAVEPTVTGPWLGFRCAVGVGAGGN